MNNRGTRNNTVYNVYTHNVKIWLVVFPKMFPIKLIRRMPLVRRALVCAFSIVVTVKAFKINKNVVNSRPNPLSLDGTFAFSLGSIGACGDVAARCRDVTCLLSFLRSPLSISN